MRRDVASLSKEGRSPADMIARGQREYPQDRLAREFAHARRWHIIYLTGTIGVIAVALGVSWFFFLRPASTSQDGLGSSWRGGPTSPPSQTPAFLPIAVNRTEEITFRLGDREGLLRALKEKRQGEKLFKNPVFLSFSIHRLDLADSEPRRATTFEVFDTLRLRPPQSLLRSFASELFPYLIADDLVFILPITDTAKALEGFLAWEPLMARDFAPLIRSPRFGFGEAGQPADSSNAPLSFDDIIIANVDARVSSSLSYAFFGGRYTVIALSEQALRTSLERLASR